LGSVFEEVKLLEDGTTDTSKEKNVTNVIKQLKQVLNILDGIFSCFWRK